MAKIICSIHGRQNVVFVSPQLEEKIRENVNISSIFRIEISSLENIKFVFFSEKKFTMNIEELEINRRLALSDFEKAIPSCDLCFREYITYSESNIISCKFDLEVL